MKETMQMRIFRPVLALILFLTAAVWISVGLSAEWYAKDVARKQTKEKLSIVESGIRSLEAEAEAAEWRTAKEGAQQYAKDLLAYVKSHVKTSTSKADLRVYNSAFEQIYPRKSADTMAFAIASVSAGESAAETMISPIGSSAAEGTESQPAGETEIEAEKEPDTDLLAACVALLKESSETGKLERIVEIEDERWYIRALALESPYRLRAKYYISTAKLPNFSSMWTYMGKLLIFVTGMAIAFGALLAWFVARGITRPLARFCEQVQVTEDGTMHLIEEHYTLVELEGLKEAFNCMERVVRQNQEDRERFFQNVSHDLRTPLVAIIGYAQGIQQGIIKDPMGAASIILSESIRMKELVESILTLSRIDHRRLKLRWVEIELGEFLEECLDTLRGMSGTCHLEFHPMEDNVYIASDPELLTRILQNVISNCVRYAEHRVQLQVCKKEHWVILTVTDDGPGFDDDALQHAFERFYKGEHGTFGIGLSVVWSGMQYLGGRVEIGNQAVPDHGAIYRLYFPQKIDRN